MTPSQFLWTIAGIALIACEAWGVYDFVNAQGSSPYLLIGGVLAAVIAPFMPALSSAYWHQGRYVWSVLVWPAFVVSVLMVLFSAAYRTGSAADDADSKIAHGNRAYALAAEIKDNAAAELKRAQGQRDIECDGKGQKGAKCTGERQAVAAAQARYDEAISALSVAPTTKSNPLSRRIAAILPVTEAQVQLYQPLMLPFVLFAFGTLCLTNGLHPRRKPIMCDTHNSTAQVAESNHKAILDSSPKRTKVAHLPGKVSKFMLEHVGPAKGERLEVSDLRIAYERWCGASNLEAAPMKKFADDVGRVCKEAGLTLVEDGENIYFPNVKIIGELRGARIVA